MLVAILFIASLWQLSMGTYIYTKAHLAQLLIGNAWQKTLKQTLGVKPWSWADTWPISRLLVPKLDIDLYVLEGSSGRTLAFGPGHMINTPLPGQGGNSVIGGHRDTHFKFLQDLRVGDLIIIETADNRAIHYKVFARSIVDYRDTEQVLAQDTPALTLVTCYPFDAIAAGGPLRFVIEARPIMPII
jgi:sortase A